MKEALVELCKLPNSWVLTRLPSNTGGLFVFNPREKRALLMANRSVEEQMDKCNVLYNIRIPDITKAHIDKMTAEEKKRLKWALLECMADEIHNSAAVKDRMIYLKSD
jgi:hypothetical protein